MKNTIDTMTYWPRKIEKTEDIPPFFKKYEKAGEEKPLYSIFFPPTPFQFIKEKAKMLVLKSDGIEYMENGFSKFLNFSTIKSIEWGSILLRGIFRIYHETRMYQINFNSAKNDLLVPFIESFRAKKDVSYSWKEKPFFHCSELEFLIKQDLKFFNVAGDTLSEKDKLLKYFYQHPFVPGEIKIGIFTKIFTPYLVMELENEWIILKEDKQTLYQAGTYGWVRQYIPKEKVDKIEFDTNSNPPFLKIAVNGNYHFKFPVSVGNVSYVRELIR